MLFSVDTGYVYSPYIPLMSSGVQVDPTTFELVVTLMTRYGKTIPMGLGVGQDWRSGVEGSEYYGKITVTGMTFQ